MKNFGKYKTYIIAEIGVNHNNNLNYAKKLILEAKKSGADAVKFQTFKASSLANSWTKKVRYQKKYLADQETHYEMLKKLELSEENHLKLHFYAKKIKIDFLSTPYDVESAKFLKEILRLNIFKIASADIIDYQLHKYLSQNASHVIISTGMSNVEEIAMALKIYTKKTSITLMHCVSNYPCSYASINLNALKVLKKFRCTLGYSDHSIGNNSACLAVAMGAKVLEKHFTLNTKMQGPDHKASLDPRGFKNFVQNIRLTELILGNFKKELQKEEMQMYRISRKSLYFSENLDKNTKITNNNLIALRPNKIDGLSPMMIPKIVGKKTKFEVKKFDIVNFKKIF